MVVTSSEGVGLAEGVPLSRKRRAYARIAGTSRFSGPQIEIRGGSFQRIVLSCCADSKEEAGDNIVHC